MDVFEEYLAKIDDADHQERVVEILNWVHETFPDLSTRVAWNQPMFTDHGTFIIGFSVAKKHMSIAPEGLAMEQFNKDFEQNNYSFGKKMFRIQFDQEVNYDLLKKIIEFNIEDKKDCTSFWRK
ncbi:iron chaperone [Companilactobacillus kedongensis]|uniref:iron chaperone n=1 Tax=Companilactobacillus kedongensis TaxID=2486004 RepID=UPI000F79B4B1|nr:iron chaperone [Companilactobacillus kedongensis]